METKAVRDNLLRVVNSLDVMWVETRWRPLENGRNTQYTNKRTFNDKAMIVSYGSAVRTEES